MNGTILRTISGAVFAAVTVAAILLSPYTYAAFILFIMTAMLIELHKITGVRTAGVPALLSLAAAASFFILVFAHYAWGMPGRFIAVSFFAVIVAFSSLVLRKDHTDFHKVAFLTAGWIWICVPLSISNMLMFTGNGDYSGVGMLCFLCMIWASDVGAYLFGMTIGRKVGGRMCPGISPNKSWAGFYGGLVTAVAASVILCACGVLDCPMLHCALLAVVMHVCGVLGDLFESLWKRHWNLKDSGVIIPGHGGMLDRFDSFLFALPSGIIYLMLSGLPG